MSHFPSLTFSLIRLVQYTRTAHIPSLPCPGPPLLTRLGPCRKVYHPCSLHPYHIALIPRKIASLPLYIHCVSSLQTARRSSLNLESRITPHRAVSLSARHTCTACIHRHHMHISPMPLSLVHVLVLLSQWTTHTCIPAVRAGSKLVPRNIYCVAAQCAEANQVRARVPGATWGSSIDSTCVTADASMRCNIVKGGVEICIMRGRNGGRGVWLMKCPVVMPLIYADAVLVFGKKYR